MPQLIEQYFMIRARGSKEVEWYYKPASGTSGATPKLYRSASVALASSKNFARNCEVQIVPVTLVIGAGCLALGK